MSKRPSCAAWVQHVKDDFRAKPHVQLFSLFELATLKCVISGIGTYDRLDLSSRGRSS